MRSSFAAVVALIVATGCGSSKTCDSTNCAGCCDASGVCQIPSANACGQHGAACQACGAGQSCQAGICMSAGTSGGAGTTGSSTTTGSSGTTTGSTSTAGGTTGAPDTQPPSILSVSPSTATVDVSSGAQHVTLTLHATDDLSGVDHGAIFLENAGALLEGDFDSSSRTQGTALDGTYAVQVPVPQYMPAGTFTTDALNAYDVAGNMGQYVNATVTQPLQVTLQVLDTNPDTQPPVLESLTASPTSVNLANGPQSVNVTLQLRDDLAGIGDGSLMTVMFSKTSGESLSTTFTGRDRTSGTALDGIYTCTISVSLSDSSGTYYLSEVDVVDAVGNRDTFGPNHWGGVTNPPSISVQ